MDTDRPITDFDIQAYVDGQLSPDRCGRVEQHLAAHPDIAAQVMADMAAVRALRELLDAPLAPPNALLATRAEALDEALHQAARRGRQGWRARIVSAAAALVAAALATVFVVQASHAAPPDFVQDALMSRKTALLRAAMDSQPEALRLDRQEISTATHIVLPVLPPSWRLTDVQVFPSDEGPSIGIAFVSPRLGKASLFAAHSPGLSEIAPTTFRHRDGVVAYWRQGDMSYALIAPARLVEVTNTARRLADSLPASGVRS